MTGLRTALAIATFERYIALAANFATLAILSRILTPSEIGISVLGTGVLLFSQSVREFSSGIYLIQRKDLTEDDLRGFVTLQFLFAVFIFLIIVAAGAAIARLYAVPELVPYLGVIAFCILFEAVSAPISALLRRDMAFVKLALVNTAGVAVYTGLAIGLAYSRFGFMSIAWAYFGSALTIAVLAAAARRDLSMFKVRIHNWNEILTFGAYNGMNIFLYRIYELVPAFALGRFVSVDAVALFNRSMTICQLPNKLILEGASAVILPAFSSAARSGKDLRAAYLSSLEYVAALQWPGYLLLAVLAHPIVEVILGPSWLNIVPVVRTMAIASLFSVSSELNYPVLVAAGGMRYIFIRSLIIWPVSSVIALAAAYFGLQAVAVAWLLIIPLQAYISIQFVSSYISLEWVDIAKALKRVAIISLSSIIAPLLIIAAKGSFDISFSTAAVAALFAAACWSTALWFADHPLYHDLRSLAAALIRGFNGRTVNSYVGPHALAPARSNRVDGACSSCDVHSS